MSGTIIYIFTSDAPGLKYKDFSTQNDADEYAVAFDAHFNGEYTCTVEPLQVSVDDL
jgi:hypothetical protein